MTKKCEKVDEAHNSRKRYKKTAILKTREIALFLEDPHVMVYCFIELVLYMIFLVIATMYVMETQSSSMFYLTQAMKNHFVERPFVTQKGAVINYHQIRSAEDFWQFAESNLLDGLFPEDDPKGMMILKVNKVIGQPTLRQIRVMNGSCAIHSYFQRMFRDCYDRYEEELEDTSAFSSVTDPGTHWTHDYKSLPFTGVVATYQGGGYYEYLGWNRQYATGKISVLKEKLWISPATRAIFCDFVVYNANLNLFLISKMVFEFPPTGGVIPTYKFRPIRLLYFWEPRDFFFLGFLGIIYFGNFIFFIVLLRNLFFFKLKMFTFFSTYLDVAILILAVLAVIKLLESQLVILFFEDTAKEILRDPYRLEWYLIKKEEENQILSVLLFLYYIKLFRYLNITKTLSQLNRTLSRCALDVLGFSFMFFIVFVAFAELGYLLFGNQVEAFSSFSKSMFTLLRTILGDFEYSQIEQANKVLAPIFFITYIILVFFVLLNMFLAIINDTYADVKKELAVMPEVGRLFDVTMEYIATAINCFSNKKKKDLKKIGGYSAAKNNIKKALKKCDFTDMEIELFFTRYELDKKLNVADDIDSEKLALELDIVSKGDGMGGSHEYASKEDFNRLRKKLTVIEESCLQVACDLEILMKKLDRLNYVRKSRRTKRDG